ncbi:MAG: TlpA family protein disulfide reductase [Candidatus Kapabacteria bacterium]|nr:TlpA family protein disulfide reductase [Candidatus Kapabacteria bacterium]
MISAKRATSISFVALSAAISMVMLGFTKPTTQQHAVPQTSIVETVTKKGAGKAPDFTFKVNGKSTTFAEISQGKPVLLNFWATWCGPCRREIPDLIALSKELSGKAVVLGVALDQGDDRVNMVKSSIERFGITYPNVIDNLDWKLAEAYGNIPSVPTTFIIDKNGTIIQKIVGAQKKEVFAAALAKAL